MVIKSVTTMEKRQQPESENGNRLTFEELKQRFQPTPGELVDDGSKDYKSRRIEFLLWELVDAVRGPVSAGFGKVKERNSPCKFCGNTILWVKNKEGRWTPLDPTTRNPHQLVCKART